MDFQLARTGKWCFPMRTERIKPLAGPICCSGHNEDDQRFLPACTGFQYCCLLCIYYCRGTHYWHLVLPNEMTLLLTLFPPDDEGNSLMSTIALEESRQYKKDMKKSRLKAGQLWEWSGQKRQTRRSGLGWGVRQLMCSISLLPLTVRGQSPVAR